MKNLLTVFVLFFCIQTGLAQDSIKVKYELGSKLGSLTIPVHLYHSIADSPYLQFVNGLFFRASKKRIGLRATVNYSQHKTESFYENIYWFALVPSGFSYNKDLQIAMGAQYNLFKKKDYLYVFTDLYYRNVISKGEFQYTQPQYGDYDFNAQSNIMGLNAGIGFKLTVFKRVCLSPEIYYDLFHSSVHIKQYSKKGDGYQTNAAYSVNNIRPAARLFLTVKF